VRDHDGALQPEQRRSAIILGVHPLGQLAQPAPLQHRADSRDPRTLHDGAQLLGGESGRAFEGLECHVAGKAVSDDHVHLACQQVRAFDIAGEMNRQSAVWRWRGEQLMGAPGQPVPLPWLGTDGEQAHPWLVDVVRDLRVGDAELRELEQHLRLGIGDGACVDEKRRIRAGGQHNGEGRPDQAGYRAQPQSCGRDDGAGGAGRDDRPSLASPDQLAGDGDAGAGAAPAGQRTLVHGDGVVGGGDPDECSGIAAGQQGAQLACTTGTPCTVAAATAPATISSGALSPPMASTATVARCASASGGASSCMEGSGCPVRLRPGGRRWAARRRRYFVDA